MNLSPTVASGRYPLWVAMLGGIVFWMVHLTAEAALVGRRPTTADLGEIAQLAVSETDPMSDGQADAGYRRKVGVKVFQRLVGEAVGLERAA